MCLRPQEINVALGLSVLGRTVIRRDESAARPGADATSRIGIALVITIVAFANPSASSMEDVDTPSKICCSYVMTMRLMVIPG